MKALKYLFFMALPLFLVGCSDSGFVFEDEDSGISIRFPGEPQSDNYTTINGNKVRNVQYEEAEIYYSLMIEFVDHEVNDTLFEIMTQATYSASESQGTEILKLEESKLNGQRALYCEQRFSPDELTKLYMVFYGDIVVNVGVTAMNSYADFEKDADSFLSSLSRIKPL